MIDKLLNAKRIAIFGYPACGKSTLSQYLSELLNIKVYSLDNMRWNTSTSKKDNKLFLEEYDNILKSSKWILDGNALDWIIARLEQADILIFFDATIDQAINNYLNRSNNIKDGLERRINFSKEGEIDNDTTIEWIKNRYSKKIEKLKMVLPFFVDKLIVINNYEELDDLLKTINNKKGSK